MTGYDTLADLAELELELVRAGETGRLPALHAERNALVATLPAMPPATARPALERTAALQARVTALLEERIGAAGVDLRRLATGRTAMRGYAPSLERDKLVDEAG